MRRLVLLAMLAWLGSMACAGEVTVGLMAALAAANGTSGCGDSYLAATESSMRLDAQFDTPGATTAVVFEMFMSYSQPPGPILLTREVVFTLPASFGFLGFDALGGPDPIQVGHWDFDWTNPNNGVFDPGGVPSDYRIPHYAIDANTAYADSLPNFSYDAGTDAIATHSLGPGGTHVLTLVLPSGATNNNGFGGNCSYFDTDVRFTLPAGILQLPQAAGSYDVTVVATSVDPDTGDADDQQGTAPTVYQRTIPITVPEPTSALGAIAAAMALGALRRRS